MGQDLDTDEPRYNEVLVITNTIQKPKRIIYPDITNKCSHLTKDKFETDEQESKPFNTLTLSTHLQIPQILFILFTSY